MPVGACMMPRLAGLLAALTALASGSGAHAAMQLDRTRLIIPEAQGTAVLHVQSEDAQPLLMQIWIDEADQADQASQVAQAGQADRARTQASVAPPSTPFITDPPVLLLAPGTRRALQVLRVDAPETLPADRESLYWLNVLEVPASVPSAPNQARLQMSVQSRLKLFYRPKALAHYDAARLPAEAQLRFTQHTDEHGQHWLVIDNPAPIHQTLASLSVQADGGKALELEAPMLAPFAQARLAWPASLGEAATGAHLHFATIDDNGNLLPQEQTLPALLLTSSSPRKL